MKDDGKMIVPKHKSFADAAKLKANPLGGLRINRRHRRAGLNSLATSFSCLTASPSVALL
jgi:hypothetical protein